MPNTNRKAKHPIAAPKPRLQVVPTGEVESSRSIKTHPRKEKKHIVRLVSGVFFSLVLVGSIFTRPSRPILPSNPFIENLFQLEQELQSGGVSAFLGAKASFKKTVGTALIENSNPKQTNAARNIATYLFPELLSETDFENEQANTSWSPLMRAIEKAPGTKESARWAQDLEATLYAYESADKTTPHLSTYTAQILKIYKSLAETTTK